MFERLQDRVWKLRHQVGELDYLWGESKRAVGRIKKPRRFERARQLYRVCKTEKADREGRIAGYWDFGVDCGLSKTRYGCLNCDYCTGFEDVPFDPEYFKENRT